MPRLVKRYAAEPSGANLAAVGVLLESAPSPRQRSVLFAALSEALAGRPIEGLPRVLKEALMKAPLSSASTEQVVLRARGGDERALRYMLDFIGNDDSNVKTKRIKFIEVLGRLGRVEAVNPLLNAARTSRWHSVRRASLSALQRFSDRAIAQAIVDAYQQLPVDQGVRLTAIEVLSRRKSWARLMLEAVQSERIARTEVPMEIVERLKRYRDEAIDRLVRAMWGRTRATPRENQARIEKVTRILASGKGDAARGKVHFTNLCARCHTLFGEGAKIAPDLTGYERDNTEFLVLSVVDPNAAIREEYTDFEIETEDGLLLSGFIRDQTPRTVTIEDGQGLRHEFERKQVVAMRAVSLSRMPEGLLDALSPRDIRDLFAYLQRHTAGASSRSGK